MRKISFFPAVFLSGFIALSLQAVLFREFLAVFSGSELAIGVFFSGWLVFSALGSLLARRISWTFFARRHFRYQLLLYVPAAILQVLVILNLRSMAGISSYELFPSLSFIWLAFLVNSPCALVSGFIFTRACHSFRHDFPQVVSRAYILEAFGTFGGGLFTLLAWEKGFSSEFIFVCALGLAFLLPILLHLFFRRYLWLSGFGLLFLIIIFSLQPDLFLHNLYGQYKWRFFLSTADGFQGGFDTAASRYIFGNFQEKQLFISNSGQMEAIPEREKSLEIAAVHLAHRPQAQRVLLIGNHAFSLIELFLEQTSIEQVDWFHPEKEYAKQILTQSASDLRTNPRFCFIEFGLERLYQEKKAFYDLVIINLPTPSTAALNRFFTREFYTDLSNVLQDNALLGVRLQAAENQLDDERIALGASIWATLKACFSQLCLKPGEESWVLASHQPLSNDLTVLEQNLRSCWLADYFNPARVLDLFPNNRIRYQRHSYTNAALKMTDPVNSATRPQAVLYSLMLASRHNGGVFADVAANLRAVGLSPLFLGLFLIVLARVLFLRTQPICQRTYRLFDYSFLVFSLGFSAIAINIILLFLFQTHFGSLYLHIGILSAVFMLGLGLGAQLAWRVNFPERFFKQLLCLPLILLMVFCIVLAPLLNGAGFFAFFCAMLIGGIFSAFPLPIVLKELGKMELRDDTQAVFLMVLDCLGGAIGAFLVGVFLLPCLGVTASGQLVAAVVFCNIFLLIWLKNKKPAIAKKDIYFKLRVVAFVFFPMLFWCFFGRQIWQNATNHELYLLQLAAQQMANGLNFSLSNISIRDDLSLPAYQVIQDDGTASYIFSTEKIVPHVTGYGGAIQLAVHISDSGKLLDFQLLNSRETPKYVQFIKGWMQSLLGRKITDSDSFADIAAVSGATMTTNAILQVLKELGLCFHTVSVQNISPAPYFGLPIFFGFLLLALVSLFGKLWLSQSKWRFWYLLSVVLVLGFWLNLQYSLTAVFGLLQEVYPVQIFSPGVFLVFFVPLIVLVFGNVYCAYLCPFGALQELLFFLNPKKDGLTVSLPFWRKASHIKYFLLFILLLFYFIGNENVAAQDPLAIAFAVHLNVPTYFWLLLIVLSAGLFPRIWCRTICPSGAFLSIVAFLLPFKRFSPMIKPGRCHVGIRNDRELDCLGCYRCLEPERQTRTKTKKNKADILFILLVILLCLIFSQPILQTSLSVEKESGVSAHSEVADTLTDYGGRPAKIEKDVIQKLIDQQKLSNQEASYYRVIP